MFPVHYLPEKLRHMENIAVKHMDAVENVITFDSKYVILTMYLHYSLVWLRVSFHIESMLYPCECRKEQEYVRALLMKCLSNHKSKRTFVFWVS